MSVTKRQLREFRDRAWALAEQLQAAECVRLVHDGDSEALLCTVQALFDARRVMRERDADEEAKELEALVALRKIIARANAAHVDLGVRSAPVR